MAKHALVLSEPAEPSFIADLARDSEKHRIQVIVPVKMEDYTKAALRASEEDFDPVNELLLGLICGEGHEQFFLDAAYILHGILHFGRESEPRLLMFIDADASELIEEIDNQPCAT